MGKNFDDLVNGAKGVFDKAAAKAGEAIDYSKTQIDRSQLRSKINDKYRELGKVCYDMHESGTDATGEMKKLIGEIKELDNKLKEADAAVNARNTKTCKSCGTQNDAVSEYCTKCGAKL